MNFKALGKMRSHPSVTARVRMEPVQFATSAKGTCECRVGRISVHVGDVGIRLAIPFLPPRRKLPLVASIGGFHFRVKPFDLRLDGIGLEIAGSVQGLAGEGEARMDCETEMEVKGKLPVKVGRISVDLDEDREE